MHQLYRLLAAIIFMLNLAVNSALLVGGVSVRHSASKPTTTDSPHWNELMTYNGFTIGLSEKRERWTIFEAEHRLGWDIFLVGVETGKVSQLTDHFASDRFPVLSPDERRVAFISWRDGNPEVYVLELGSGELRNISKHPAIDLLAVWSPGGTMLAFVSERDGDAEIYLADVARGMLYNLTQNPAHDTSPQWSPDGASILFRSNRSGKMLDYRMVISGQHIVNAG